MGLDQLQSGILQQQNSIMQSQSFPPLQLLNPQQQQLLIQEQQSTMSPSFDDIDNQRLRMLLNNRNIVFGKDCVPNVVDVSQNAGSPIQAVPNVLPRGDTDMLIKRHTNPVHSVCWDKSGEYFASVSEDLVRIWKLGSGSVGECIHELSCNGNKFQSCVFHPTHPSLLVIGCYQSLELWDMAVNKTMTHCTRGTDFSFGSLQCERAGGFSRVYNSW